MILEERKDDREFNFQWFVSPWSFPNTCSLLFIASQLEWGNWEITFKKNKFVLVHFQTIHNHFLSLMTSTPTENPLCKLFSVLHRIVGANLYSFLVSGMYQVIVQRTVRKEKLVQSWTYLGGTENGSYKSDLFSHLVLHVPSENVFKCLVFCGTSVDLRDLPTISIKMF